MSIGLSETKIRELLKDSELNEQSISAVVEVINKNNKAIENQIFEVVNETLTDKLKLKGKRF